MSVSVEAYQDERVSEWAKRQTVADQSARVSVSVIRGPNTGRYRSGSLLTRSSADVVMLRSA